LKAGVAQGGDGFHAGAHDQFGFLDRGCPAWRHAFSTHPARRVSFLGIGEAVTNRSFWVSSLFPLWGLATLAAGFATGLVTGFATGLVALATGSVATSAATGFAAGFAAASGAAFATACGAARPGAFAAGFQLFFDRLGRRFGDVFFGRLFTLPFGYRLCCSFCRCSTLLSSNCGVDGWILFGWL